MDVKVKAPFTMGGQKFIEGDKIKVEPEKAKSLACSGLVHTKVVDKPPKDKMLKSPVKTKSKRRKR